MEIVISFDGRLHAIYDDAFGLQELGNVSIRRASHVEPTEEGMWLADLSPMQGPVLGPFVWRQEAVEAELGWLRKNWLTNVT